MIGIELLALNLITEAWVGQFSVQESEPILHLICVVLCGDIDVASAFHTGHLVLNLNPSVSPFAWFSAQIN